jgi:hypothetical protein
MKQAFQKFNRADMNFRQGDGQHPAEKSEGVRCAIVEIIV